MVWQCTRLLWNRCANDSERCCARLCARLAEGLAFEIGAASCTQALDEFRSDLSEDDGKGASPDARDMGGSRIVAGSSVKSSGSLGRELMIAVEEAKVTGD